MDIGNVSDDTKMEIDAIIKGNQLLAYTMHLRKLIDSYILEPELYQKDFERISYTLVHKLCSLLDTSSFLLVNANLDSKPHFIDSSFIILRTCLSDAIYLYFIIDKHDDAELLQKRIERIMSDHLRYSYLEAETEAKKQAIRDEFPQWFDGLKFKRSIKALSPFSMYDEIENINIKDEAKVVFTMYNYFSKLEHNGFFSFDILHRHFDAEGNIIDKAMIYHAICRVMISVNLALEIWIDNTDNDYKRLIELSKLFMS